MSCWCNIHFYFSKVSHIYGFIMNLFSIIWHNFVYMTNIDKLYIQRIDNLYICCMENLYIFLWKKVSVHTTYIKLFYTFYGHKVSVHTAYWQVVYMLYRRKPFVHAKYRQIVHMLYGKLHYHCAFVWTDWINSIFLIIGLSPCSHSMLIVGWWYSSPQKEATGKL